MHTQDLIRKQPITTPHWQPRRRVVVMRVARLVDYWVFAAGLAVGAALAYPLITHP
jgi:type VI protein secretion system component VasF